MSEIELNKNLYKEIVIEEEIESEGISSEDDLMSDPFNASKISISLKSPTISFLVDMMKQDPSEIDLNTDFQISGDLWGPEKQSRLIESVLIKFPLPAFYFDAESDKKWLVVDGLQRLCSFNNFIVKGTLRLKGLEFLKHLEGKGYSELDRSLQRLIDQTQLIAYVINPGTPVNVKYNIFKRINTGGLILKPQEIRHALFQGTAATFVKDLASLESFKSATENKIPTNRMLDREFANRFIAFFLTPPEDYKPDLESFLSDAMEKLQHLDESSRKEMVVAFDSAMKTAKAIFDNWAFRKADQYPDRIKPINKAVFEVWAVELAKLSFESHKILINKKTIVLEKFVNLCKKDQRFVEAISQATGDKNRTLYRFKKVKELIQEILNDK
ncbi:MAG: DUF262 domain-containing protein [Fibrobacterota bacterium]|nr:DUF262 domain-containing protein [Chitinispirillaceae bacterium]